MDKEKKIVIFEKTLYVVLGVFIGLGIAYTIMAIVAGGMMLFD